MREGGAKEKGGCLEKAECYEYLSIFVLEILSFLFTPALCCGDTIMPDCLC